MSEILKPSSDFAEIKSVSAFLKAITDWRALHRIAERGFHSRVWYRGHSKRTYSLAPGVYRSQFTSLAKACWNRGDDEERRLTLERDMLGEFRTTGATFFNADRIISLYFIAQHNGMPTRLLAWTSNPVAGLFFAVETEDENDGDVFVMEPTKLIPLPTRKPDKSKPNLVWPHIHSMRHPFVTDRIGITFWHEPKNKWEPETLIIPVRPDNTAGRIGQQSSCFTLHMHKSESRNNPTLAQIKIPAEHKSKLRAELHSLNINRFTIFNDLDHLSAQIKQSWGF
jgi:hypothetical protein